MAIGQSTWSGTLRPAHDRELNAMPTGQDSIVLQSIAKGYGWLHPAIISPRRHHLTPPDRDRRTCRATGRQGQRIFGLDAARSNDHRAGADKPSVRDYRADPELTYPLDFAGSVARLAWLDAVISARVLRGRQMCGRAAF